MVVCERMFAVLVFTRIMIIFLGVSAMELGSKERAAAGTAVLAAVGVAALAVSEMSKETGNQRRIRIAAERREAEKKAAESFRIAAAELKEAQERGGKLARERAGARKRDKVKAKADAKAAKDKYKEDQMVKEAIVAKQGEERRQVYLQFSVYAHFLADD